MGAAHLVAAAVLGAGIFVAFTERNLAFLGQYGHFSNTI